MMTRSSKLRLNLLPIGLVLILLSLFFLPRPNKADELAHSHRLTVDDDREPEKIFECLQRVNPSSNKKRLVALEAAVPGGSIGDGIWSLSSMDGSIRVDMYQKEGLEVIVRSQEALTSKDWEWSSCFVI